MSPLDLHGPQFLAFYVAWSAGVLAVLLLVRSFWERSSPPSGTPIWAPGVYPGERDGYAIALLRGGPEEAAKALLGRLVSTGHLEVQGQKLRLAAALPEGAPPLAPIEAEALRAVFRPGGPAVEGQEAEKRACRAMERQVAEMGADLERQGLAPPAEQRRIYRLQRWTALAAVPGLGGVKLLIAWSQGRSNVGYLITLTFVFLFVSAYLFRTPPNTVAGRRYLAWLKESHRGLVQKVAQRQWTGAGEIALVAGVYGLKALPDLSPLARALSGWHSSGDGGSGCGSGCGGGGCGG
jgi:uncharacterized protein (TIGR04222 family)